MISRFGLVITVFILISFKIFSQDILKNQFEYAVRLFNEEQYYDAITEFKRLLFFDKSKKYMFEANEYIGKSYKMGAKFSDAILYFTYAEMSANNEDEIFESKIEIIRSNILRRTPLHAISLLDSLRVNRRFFNKSKEIHYWLGWSYIFNNQWDEAAKEFNLTDTNKTLVELCKKTYDKKYSASFAKIISLFIPGAGQAYTGHYFSGALSLGWNILWGYTTINAFAANRIFDGLVVGNLLWFRFYNGNLQNAYNFAVEENLIITNSAMNYLQFEFKGLKP